MRIIFLDIDGVLNSSVHHAMNPNCYAHLSDPKSEISAYAVNLLKLLVAKSNAKIVICSTWRKDEVFIEQCHSDSEIIAKFNDLFAQFGWDSSPVIGITPILSGFRGQEIATYLDNSDHFITDYVVLDDSIDYITTTLYDLDDHTLYNKLKLSAKEIGDKSHHWQDQWHIHINPLCGLTYLDILKVLLRWEPTDILIRELTHFQSDLKKLNHPEFLIENMQK